MLTCSEAYGITRRNTVDIMEIVLLIVGCIVFILSFFIPSKNEDQIKEIKTIAKDEIRDLVVEEMKFVKSDIEDIVDETVQYSLEKTERSLERLTNEKIMAVNEYSDTVLDEVNKNHKEVLFLYEMLNDKHEQIKDTFSEISATVRNSNTVVESPKEDIQKPQEKKDSTTTKQPLIDGAILKEKEIEEHVHNSNELILEMYKIGKSKTEIAQELNLGVGEVKLVIDLYKGMAKNI